MICPYFSTVSSPSSDCRSRHRISLGAFWKNRSTAKSLRDFLTPLTFFGDGEDDLVYADVSDDPDRGVSRADCCDKPFSDDGQHCRSLISTSEWFVGTVSFFEACCDEPRDCEAFRFLEFRGGPVVTAPLSPCCRGILKVGQFSQCCRMRSSKFDWTNT